MKHKKFITACATILVFVGCIGLLFGCTNPEKYKKEVEDYGIFKNSTADALPQTAFHDIAVEHFNSEVVDGKAKKALILTLDGMRADAFRLFKDYGQGIMRFKDSGGIYLAYAGGEKKSFRTDTAPGTVSLLTGKWADSVGVLTNTDEKGVEPHTLVTSALQKNLSVQWTVGWKNHISVTFRKEIEAAQAAGLALVAEAAATDREVQQKVLESIRTKDVTLGLYAEPDGTGHRVGFSPDISDYAVSVCNTNALIEEAIQAVYARPTFAKEDWLILLATDHGGQKNKNHYQASITERLIFIATNKPLVVANYLHTGYEL